MKNIILTTFLFFNFFVFGQTTEKKDTTIVCFPTEIGRKILQDLNELDKLKKVTILDKREIEEFEKKIIKKDSIISKLEEKDRSNEILVKSTEEKYKLVEEDNENLRQQIKNIKLKNNIIEIVSAVIFSTITYIQLFK